MMLKMYTVKDTLAEFSGPLAFKDENLAKRWFEAFCMNKKNTEYTNPKYFELWEIGHFDPEKGTIIGYQLSELKLIEEGANFNE